MAASRFVPSANADNVELDRRVAEQVHELHALQEVVREKDVLLTHARQQQSALESANRLTTDFLAVLSHEFRTPLQAICGYADFLEQELHGPLTELQRRDVQRIKRGQEHLLALVNTILDFAKLKSGQAVALDLGPVPVGEVLSALLPLAEPQLVAKKVALTYMEPDVGVVVFADRERAQQIVLNLLSNAIKFTEAGGTISVDALTEPGCVAVRVRDTGRGIPGDKLDLIFEPFVQIRGGGEMGGTGLGLSISRGLAEAMGGSLVVESELGVGSTFVLRLPTPQPR